MRFNYYYRKPLQLLPGFLLFVKITLNLARERVVWLNKPDTVPSKGPAKLVSVTQKDKFRLPPEDQEFVTTHWSLVLRAGGSDDAQSAAALESLCRAYWYPLYYYVRRQVHDSHQAEDLTQDFFLRVLQKKVVGVASPDRGRFRSFLLTSLKNFLANEWEKARTARRGGGQPHLSLQAEQAEERFHAEPADYASPDRIFEKRWAETVVQNTLLRLEAEYQKREKVALFDALKDSLWGDADECYTEVASRLNVTEGALRIAVYRMREHFRHLLREEVARTVGSPDEIDHELRHLIQVLRG